MHKQKQKILNMDEIEDSNLNNASDEDKTTVEEEKEHKNTTIWKFENQKY
ncbi:hypothetical protein JMUB7504_27050 [Staphylococcus aureus]